MLLAVVADRVDRRLGRGVTVALDQFDADHQPEPAHIADGGVRVVHLVEPAECVICELRYLGDDVGEPVDGCRRRGARDRVAPEGRSV